MFANHNGTSLNIKVGIKKKGKTGGRVNGWVGNTRLELVLMLFFLIFEIQ
jgi:hypothetical protein